MAKRNAHTCSRERSDKFQRDPFRRQRDEHRTPPRCGQELQVLLRGLAKRARIVDAGLFRRQKRPFEMDPEDAGLHANKTFHRIAGRRHLFRAVADESGEERRRAEFSMRGGDRTNGVRRRLIVEQDVAAAIDLDVDKAGSEPRVRGQVHARGCARQFGTRNDGGDRVALDHHGAVFAQRYAVEDAAGGDGVNFFAHRVRVTFCR